MPFHAKSKSTPGSTQARSLWTKIVGSQGKEHLGCGEIVPSYRKPPALSDWLIATHEQNTSRMTTTFYLMDKVLRVKYRAWLRSQLAPSGPEIWGLVGDTSSRPPGCINKLSMTETLKCVEKSAMTGSVTAKNSFNPRSKLNTMLCSFSETLRDFQNYPTFLDKASQSRAH